MENEKIIAHFTTPKGTTLPVIEVKGKPYLKAAHRIQWFREEKPDWTLNTTLVHFTPEFAVVRTEVKDKDGKTISSAHSKETSRGFPKYVEKAETAANARALALAGFGTQFAEPDFEEDDVVDAPTQMQSSVGHNTSSRPRENPQGTSQRYGAGAKYPPKTGVKALMDQAIAEGRWSANTAWKTYKEILSTQFGVSKADELNPTQLNKVKTLLSSLTEYEAANCPPNFFSEQDVP